MVANYTTGIWKARYFWMHLALADLRARWRRSVLGLLWSIIQPLGMTLLLTFVFSKLFSINFTEYAPYILSGMLIWECVTLSAMNGSLAFVQAEAYIKQYRHPLAIYTLRIVLTNLMVLTLASVSLVGWILVVSPQRVGWPWLAALTIFPIIMLMAWPLATLLAYIATRFRDLPHALGLIFQAMWFVSPIYFEVRLFRNGGLNSLVDYNPIYHMLQIMRAPLLQGQWPTMENYAYCFGTILFLIFLAYGVGRQAEKKVIFYL